MRYYFTSLSLNIPSKIMGLIVLCSTLLTLANTTYADKTLVELTKKVSPAVVIIQTFDKDQTPLGQGSGFFINDEGELITNWHVIENAYMATVRLTTGETYFVEGLLAIDTEVDVVKLKVKTNRKPVPFVTLVDKLPNTGEDIIVVGNPLGLESTLSKGIVSAVRNIPNLGKILQISAPISTGSSGSPVLNMSGQVVGVATFTVSDGQAINFAIPSNMLLNLKSEDAPTKLSDIQLIISNESTLSGGLSSSKAKASENPCLRFLPSDWWLVGNVNLKAYFDLVDSLGQNNPGMATVTQYVEMLKGLIGIDISNEVQYTTFILSGNPDESFEFLIVAKGTFDNAISEMRLRLGLGAGMQTITYRGTKLYHQQDAEIGYAFPEESTLMMGSLNMLGSSVDMLTQRTKLMPDSLHRILESTNGASIVWSVVKPDVVLNMAEIKKMKQQHPDIFERISTIEYTSLFFEPTHDGVLASLLAYLPEKQKSNELYYYLRETKQNLLTVEGANVFLCSFLMLSDVVLDGNYVRWNSHLTVDALTKLWITKVLLK